MNTTRRILLLLREPPYGSGRALEAVDVALVASAFEHEVTVLFEGLGVWQLLRNQDGSALGTRTQGKVLGALPHYDVTRLHVCADSLAGAGLQLSDLVLAVTPLSRAQQRELLACQHAVITD